MMKDISLNSKTTDPNTANGNTTDATKPVPNEEDINNEKSAKNSSKKSARMASTDGIVNYIYNMYTESCDNNKDETKKVVETNDEQGMISEEEVSDEPVAMEEPADNGDETPVAPASAVFVPKYKYNDEQWSSLNQSGKKCYDLELLKQIKNDPLSKNKPNAPLLEACDVIRTAPMDADVPMPFSLILRSVNDILLPSFLKGHGCSRNDSPRDPKKNGKGRLGQTRGSSPHKSVIHVSLSSREDVKLNQVDCAWKPTRLVQENLSEEEIKTQELFKKFRGILNKLTPQKFDTLLKKVLELEIDNQKRMEGVIDLLFEKAIEEPNFSEVYANMCLKLGNLRVPSDSNLDHLVNFRGLIINKCQTQFETGKSDEQLLMKLEKESAETADLDKKKELQTMINEENRKIRLRSVANVRFIGELYKLKMLTFKIINYCMRHLIDPLEEENLECLCKLLTTIGEQVDNEGGTHLDSIFKSMQEIVKRKSNQISSRVKFMIQDVIDLRRRKWLVKSVVDSQPKMMDQIQKEAEQQQRHIELMNAGGGGSGGFRRDDGGSSGGFRRDDGGSSGGFRRDDGGRSKRGGDSPRISLKGAALKPTRPASTNYKVDQFKLQAGSNQKILANIKLAPPKWMVPKPQQPSAPSNISISTNMYSVLENVDADPTSNKAVRDTSPPPACSEGASIETSTLTSSGDFAGSRDGSECVSSSPCTNMPQEPLPHDVSKKVRPIVDLSLINHDDEQFRQEILQFDAKYHAAVIALILNQSVEKTGKDVTTLTQSIVHLVSTNTISPENFEAGLKETLYMAPDQYIDVPKFYENIGIILAPHIEKKHITIAKTFDLCGNVIAENQGHLLLNAIIHNLMESMGPTFVKDKWQESGLQLSQWMNEEQVPKWIADNKFEFLEDQETQTNYQADEETAKLLNPAETQTRLLQLMNSDETCDFIKGWVQDKLGKVHNEDWFMQALIQAICKYALYGNEGRDFPRFNRDRMNKYAGLIHEFGDSKESREVNCLEGIQQLFHRLGNPQGLTPEIFQYLQEQSLIPLDA